MDPENYTGVYELYRNNSTVTIVRKVNTSKEFAQKCTLHSSDSEREATVHHLLSFKNLKVVDQHKFFSKGGYMYSLMDYAPRGSLKDYVNALEQPLSSEAYLNLIYRLLAAVETLHASGWAHGNIRPENFVQDEKGVWLLIDFGATRRIQKVENLKRDNPAGPTKYSTRPERHFCEDVWWLGFTCYWVATRDNLLTGKPPVGQNWLLDEYVKDCMGPLYDRETIWIVRQMINLNDSERGSLGFLRSTLDSIIPQALVERPPRRSIVCELCGEEAPDEEFCVTHTCERTICLDCYGRKMEEVASTVQDINDFLCALCHNAVSNDLIVHYANALGPIAKLKVYSLMLLELNSKCPKENCCGEVKRYKNKSEGWSQITPYTATCEECSLRFCSLCKERGGHVKNGYSELCPRFDKNQLRNLL